MERPCMKHDHDNDGSPARSSSLSPLMRLDVQVADDTEALLDRAESAVRTFDRHFDNELDARAFADSCLNIELIADAKMNGKQSSAEQYFRSAYKRLQQQEQGGAHRSENLQSAEALRCALDLGGKPVTPESFYEIHRRLLAGTTREPYQTLLRTSPSQVGGSRFHRFGSPYHTPDPDDIPGLLNDMALFCNVTSRSAIEQAALVHVQFNAVHPFERANGKTARIIIQLIFRRRGLIEHAVAPITSALVTSSHDYQNGVTVTMENLTRSNPDQYELNAWLQYFAECCIQAADETRAFDNEVAMLQSRWLARLGTRANSAATLLVQALPALPVFTASSAAAFIDRSFKRASTAIDALESASIITQISEGKRNRVFECPDIISAYARIKGFQ
jgi:Fic family protein